MNYEYEDLDGNTAVITRAVNLATSKGMLCVISAGNEGSGQWRYVSPPADAIDVLAVGAVSSGGDRVSFSSFGPTADGRVKPDVSALGLQTVVVDAGGNVTRSNGTSFSAPLLPDSPPEYGRPSLTKLTEKLLIKYAWRAAWP